MFERFTRQARSAVVRAQVEARQLGHGWVGTEHLLLAVLREPADRGAVTLVRTGVTAEACRSVVAALVPACADPLGPGDAEALAAFGIDLDEIRDRTEAAFGPGALDGPCGDPPRRLLGRRRSRNREPRAPAHLPFAPRAKKALELCLRETLALRDRRIGTEHLLLGLLRSDDRVTRTLLEHLDLDPGRVRDLVLAERREAA